MTRSQVRGVVLVAIACALFFFVHTSSFGTFPLYVSARGGSEAEIALIIGLIGPISLITRPFTGWAIDAWGRKAMLVFGIGLFAVSMFAYGFLASILLLAIFRGIHGTAIGIVNTASNTYVADLAPPQRRGEVLGYLAAAQTLAGSIAPTLGFAIITWSALDWSRSLTPWWGNLTQGTLGEYNFGAYFFAMTVLAVLGMIVGAFAIDAPRPAIARAPSLRGMIDRRAALPMALLMTIVVPFICAITYLPFFAPGRGLENVGLYFTSQALGNLAAGLVLGRMADRMGRRPIVIACLYGGTLAMLLLALAPGGAFILIAGAISGFCQGGARTTLAAYTADSVPPADRGSALSTFGMGFDLGTGAAAPVLAIAASLFGVAAAFYAAGFIVLIGAVAASVFLHDRPALG